MRRMYADVVPVLEPIKKKKIAHRRGKLTRLLHFFLFGCDILAFVILGYALFLGLQIQINPTTVVKYTAAISAGAFFFAAYAFTSDFYDWRRFRQTAARPLVAFRAAIFSFGCVLTIAFLFKETAYFSRLWGLSWIFGFFAYILISRTILLAYLTRAARVGLYVRKAVIVGAGEVGRDVLKHIQRFSDHTVHVVGFLDDRVDRIPSAIRGVPVLGRTSVAERLVRQEGVDLVIMALPWSAEDRIRNLVRHLSMWAADIYMAPDKLGLSFADRPIFRMAGMNMLSLKDRPISEWGAVVKRLEDLCLAIPALIFLSPLLAIVALAIKLESKGPALFTQDRDGFNNNVFRVYKFRSMYLHQADAHCAQQTTRNDPRVTRVGRIIRRTNIDELPQLLNVLKGDMSIVGPRPHAKLTKAGGRLFHDVIVDYARRHRVKPGITGWAQCNGWRGETDTEEKIIRRFEHDLYYIENWSIYLDFIIIFKTALRILIGDRSAY